MKEFVIKPARNQQELEQCLSLRKKVFTEEKGISSEIERDEQDNLLSDCDHFWADLEGIPTAACRCRQIGNQTIKLERFCVLKEYRSKGIGKQFLEELEEYYREKGVLEIEIDSKYQVFPFYQKCGYQICSGIFLEAGVEHLKMKKTI